MERRSGQILKWICPRLKFEMDAGHQFDGDVDRRPLKFDVDVDRRPLKFDVNVDRRPSM